MEHLKKDILFTAAAMMNDAAAEHSGQGALFVEDLLSSSCELAVEQFAPLREVRGGAADMCLIRHEGTSPL